MRRKATGLSPKRFWIWQQGCRAKVTSRDGDAVRTVMHQSGDVMQKKPLFHSLKIAVFSVYYLLVILPLVVSAAQVTLQWDADTSSIDGFRLFQRQVGGEYDYDTPVWSGTDTNCTITNLNVGTTYYFVLRAFNGAEESGDSNEVAFTPSESQPQPDLDGDMDADGVGDVVDAFPQDPTEWIDSDADGIGNNADSDDDNDGMSDNWEFQYGLNPLVDDALYDLDGDGLANIDEYDQGSDPAHVPGNDVPDQPVLSRPPHGSTVGLTPTLETGAFADADNDLHARTHYQISTTQDFSALVFERITTVQLVSFDIFDLVLDPDTTYYWRAKFHDSRNGTSPWSEISAFTTIDYATAGDGNGNGVFDDQEIDASVDLDEDGLTDDDQPGLLGVKTLDAMNPHLAIKRGSDNFEIVSFRALDPNTDISINTNMPDQLTGFISFKLYLDQGVTTATVTVHFSSPAPPGAQWYKYDTDDGWTAYPHATFSGDRRSLTFVLEDGGPGDQDGVQNGVIVDPAALGYSRSSDGGSSNAWDVDLYGYSCFIATPMQGSENFGSAVKGLLTSLLLLGIFCLVWPLFRKHSSQT